MQYCPICHAKMKIDWLDGIAICPFCRWTEPIAREVMGEIVR